SAATMESLAEVRPPAEDIWAWGAPRFHREVNARAAATVCGTERFRLRSPFMALGRTRLAALGPRPAACILALALPWVTACGGSGALVGDHYQDDEARYRI